MPLVQQLMSKDCVSLNFYKDWARSVHKLLVFSLALMGSGDLISPVLLCCIVPMLM